MKYKVEHLLDNSYQVVQLYEDASGSGFTGSYIDREECNDVKFQGTLSDCEAWIRLNEQGYMS